MLGRLLLALALINVAVPAMAAVLHVEADGSGQFPVISVALLAAQPGDTVLLAPGTYTGPMNTELDFAGKDLVLMGAGPEATILDCQDSGHAAVDFHSGETRAAVLRDMTLRNNYHYYQPTGITIVDASPTLDNLHLEDFDGVCADQQYNWYSGAAIYSYNGSPLAIHVEVRNCGCAGSIYAQGGQPEFKDVLVEGGANGYASGGGMVFHRCAALLTEVTLRNCWSFEGGGGAVACVDTPSPTFEDCRFEDNYAYSEYGGGFGGGGIICFGGASPTLRRCIFLRNTARDGGGGLAAYEGSAPLLEDVLFVDCGSASGGGAIYLDGATATLNRVTITGSGLHDGYHEENARSVILCVGSSPSLERVIVAFNPVGVGLWTDAASAPTLSCCDFAANTEGNYGGSMVDPTGTNGNIALDPLFCGSGEPELALAPASGSPCAPANNDCGVLIGALPVGCDLAAYTISGHVVDGAGLPLAGIAIDGLGYALNTDAAGDYSVAKLAGWSGTLTPLRSGYVFTPARREYVDLQTDQLAQDYLGARRTLHRVPADHISLGAAFAAALAGDTILVAPGTYAGSENRNLDFGDRNLVVMSESGAALTILDCEEVGRAFYLHGGQVAASRIEGFTIVNGKAPDGSGYDKGGGLYAWNASPTLRDLRLVDCSAEYGGGLALDGSTTQADSLLATGCTADYDGAGIFVTGSSVTLSALTLMGNITPWGGGGLALKNGSTATLARVLIAGNSAGDGGGIYCREAGNTLQISCSNLFGNAPNNYGNCPDPTGADGNLAEDPLLCEPEASDFRLHADSPCAAAQSGCGADIGYFGVGCADPRYAIAGHVRTAAAVPVPEAAVSGYFFPLATDSAGAWAFSVSAGWSGFVSADRDGYDITPTQLSYTNVQEDWLDQDFTAQRITRRRVPQDLPSIQAALAAVTDGDTVLVAPGTYSGPGFLEIDLLGKDARVIGEGGASATVIDCAGAGRGFHVYRGESPAALIQGFTVRAGTPIDYFGFGGGLCVSNASPTLRDLVVVDCSLRYTAGGLYFSNSQSLLEDLEVRNCRNTGQYNAYGGGVACENADITLRRVLLAGNYSHRDGGGIYCRASSPILEQVTVVDNSTAWGGGGIGVDSGSAPVLSACLIANNSASDGGGLYARDTSSAPTVFCTDAAENSPSDYGGNWADPTGEDGNISEPPLFCDAYHGDYHLVIGSPCLPAGNGCGVQMGAYGEGCDGTPADDAPPARFAFLLPQPNPFNPKTTLRFALPRAASVDLAIFDVNGRRVVRLLAGETLPAGNHAVDWEGRDEAGRALPSGVYFARFAASGFTEERKLVLLR
jgi:hypothetical protein